jgi:hypothetical protein
MHERILAVSGLLEIPNIHGCYPEYHNVRMLERYVRILPISKMQCRADKERVGVIDIISTQPCRTCPYLRAAFRATPPMYITTSTFTITALNFITPCILLIAVVSTCCTVT